MDAYAFDPGEVRRQKKAGIFKERLRLSGYRTGKTNQLDQKKKGVKKDYEPKKVVSDPIKVGSDCSGLGTEIFGMDVLGLGHRLDHEFGSESDETRRRVFQWLHPGCKKMYRSCRVQDRKPASVPRVDLYVAGGDCSSWSKAGKRQGLDDKCNRGQLMFDIVAYIETKQPKTFILEQVEGMLKGKFLTNFTDMIEHITSIKHYGERVYHVEFQVLNTSEICGISQNRSRVYIVGAQKKLMNAESFTWPGKVPMVRLSAFLVGNTGTLHLPTSWTALRNISTCIDDIIEGGGNVNQMWVIDVTPSETFGKCYTLEKTPTITKTRANFQGFFLSKYMRMTTTDELKRLQGFPASLPKFHATDNQLRYMLGNAMTLPVLARVMRMVLGAAGFINTADVPDIFKPIY